MPAVEESPIIIDKIYIDKFRRFNNVEFVLSGNITLIAGQNGTSKSTLLGMLCQPFSFGNIRGPKSGADDNSMYTKNYHGLKLNEFTGINGSKFSYDSDEVFRLSNRHDTLEKKYKYKIFLQGTCLDSNSAIESNGLQVEAKKRNDRIRFVAGPGGSHEAGEGNFPHPVIYLGLNRLWPLAMLKRVNVGKTKSTSEVDQKWYVKKYNEILVLDESENDTELLQSDKGFKQDFIGPASKDYNSESCSAGQDNLGQILTSIISFRNLKKTLGSKYQGGLLLVDELDASFHAIAQFRLLKTLIEVSKELNLQIIATTHSMGLLHHVFKSECRQSTKVLYLIKYGNDIVDSNYDTYEAIEDDLKVKSTQTSRTRTKKISVFLEDGVSKSMFWNIIGPKLKKYIKVHDSSSLSAGSLLTLCKLSKQVHELKKIVIIPDGDMEKDFQAYQSEKNIMFLPGDKCPEELVFINLHSTDDNNPFWKKCISPRGTYTKQVAIVRYTSGNPTPSDPQAAKKWYKKWFKEQLPYWGNASNIAFKKWLKDNKDISNEFCKQFVDILRSLSPEQIPKEITDFVKSKYSK